ncbi:MAG: hypothetical protein CMD50_04085 [Gammaproteobacteria bacterium]|nr:hypothetical protein [Gammaproteobacteria bacterium]|tara:strand:+ start:2406 stop:2906 length:501 start_codon:yes stop_codon:yes gene_type:complete
MINTNKALNRLIKDLKDSSPNLENSIKEIAPLSFLLNIKGHKNVYITINEESSNISFSEQSYDFEIRASLIDVIKLAISGKLNKGLVYGNSEIAVVLFNAIHKSNIDLIYLIDKYFGSLPAVFTYTIVKKVFKSSEIYQDKNYRDIRKRLRDIAIRLDRLEVLKSS